MNDDLSDLLGRFEICIREEEHAAEHYAATRAKTETVRQALREWMNR